MRQVRGSAARTDDRLLAAQVPTPTPGSVTVEVQLPELEASSQQNSFCNIGRLAEVRFARRLGYVEHLRLMFGRLMSRKSEIAANAPTSK